MAKSGAKLTYIECLSGPWGPLATPINEPERGEPTLWGSTPALVRSIDMVNIAMGTEGSQMRILRARTQGPLWRPVYGYLPIRKIEQPSPCLDQTHQAVL